MWSDKACERTDRVLSQAAPLEQAGFGWGFRTMWYEKSGVVLAVQETASCAAFFFDQCPVII
jgi:hypothetical protein